MSLNPLSSQSGSSVTPTVLVDPADPTRTLKINADGSLNTSGGGTGGSSDVAIHDNTTTTYHLKVNADGSINTAVTSGGGGVASSVALNDGTTTTQKLAIDASGKLGVNNFPATQPVSGSVSVSNLPATQPVSGTVAVSNFPATQPVSGSVSVSNLSTEQAVNVNQVNGATLSAGNPIFTAVQNFPATQPVSGSVSVSNLTAEQAVNMNQVNGVALSAANPVFTSVQNFPSSQTVAGSVSVSNLPATQPVSGSLNLADPTTPAYKLKINSDGSINTTGGGGGGSGSTVITDGTTLTQKLAVDASGKIGINNLPATQPVSGSVSVSNFPATQPVSGSVSLAAGSALAGGVNLIDSAGTNKAAVDASGNISVKQVGALPAGTNTLGVVNVVDSAGTNKLKVNADGSVNTAVISGGGGSSITATQDGLGHASVPEAMLAAYSSGGPVLASGLASGLDTERVRTFQGKLLKTVTITSTAVGDASLTCTAGVMNLLVPGQMIRLGPSAIEYVVVSASYTPATSATSIPLQSPVVSAGHTQANFDAFGISGPGISTMLPTGVPVHLPVFYDSTGQFLQAAQSAASDGQTPGALPEVVTGFFTASGSSINRQQGRWGASDVAFGGRTAYPLAAGYVSNYAFNTGSCRLGQILVTAVGTNNMLFYDHASLTSGTIIAIIPSTATLGQLFTFQMPCANGILSAGNAGNPGITLTLSN